MLVGLHDSDKTNFPNLALMKLSAFYRSQGHHVEFYDWRKRYDITFASKVFSFTGDIFLFGNVVKGGIGYDEKSILPDIVEHTCPDYPLYVSDRSYGFLTRGCPNKCTWCVVPHKEGNIRANANIEEFLRHDKVVFLDNNVLASKHGIKEIEKLKAMNVKVDFNQGLDARLIDNAMAKLLAKLKWLHPIRLACDSQAQMRTIQKAVTLLRWHNATPRQYFVYVLVKDVEEALERIMFLKGIYCDPFAQPFIDFKNPQEPTKKQKAFARWVNLKQLFKSVPWEKYKYNSAIEKPAP